MSKHKHHGEPEPEAPQFKEGHKVWVMEPNGTAREAICVGEAEQATFFGGPPKVYVVFTDTREGAAIDMDRVTARD